MSKGALGGGGGGVGVHVSEDRGWHIRKDKKGDKKRKRGLIHLYLDICTLQHMLHLFHLHSAVELLPIYFFFPFYSNITAIIFISLLFCHLSSISVSLNIESVIG